jgi:hypothetical protein
MLPSLACTHTHTCVCRHMRKTERHWWTALNKKSSRLIKVKVKFSLCSNQAPRHEGVLGEWLYSSTHSLTSALDGGEWSASRSGHLTPRERAPGTRWLGGWLSPRAVLGSVVKKKISSPRRESNPRTPIVQPVAQCYTNWAVMALSRLM